MISLNINNRVTVRLTEHGKRVFRQHWALYGITPTDNLDEPMRLHLWEVMEIFGGRNISTGMPEVPFVGNSLVIELKE